MPSKYRPGSEYKKKFRWHESVKSASFSPSREQSAPKAGLGSGEIGFVRSDIREPPLQRRRKPLENPAAHTVNTNQDNLGKARQTLASARTYKIPQHKAADKSSSDRHTKSSLTTNGQVKPSIASGQQKAPPSMGVTRVISSAPRKERHDSGGRSSETNKNNNKTTRKAKNSPRVSDAKNGSSGDKVKSNIALQYQAGIHPNRPKGAKYLSEYQRQFEWKKPLTKESPLLAAEQMVYSSNTNIAPFVPDKIPRHTEYQKQFKAWQPLQPPAQDQLLMENAKRDIKAKYMVKTKSKKTKKSNTTPDRMRAAGMPSALTSPEQVQHLKNAQNPQQPFFPHSTTRKWKTEYKSNYKSPTKFSYEDGVWKGAGPPHIQPKDDMYSDTDRRQRAPLRRTKSQHDLPNWFAEVMELREKAQEYQQRARGTHFSRQHTAQLIANQAKMWDESSCTSNTTSSLSAPSVDIDRQNGPRNSGHPTQGLVSRPGEGGQNGQDNNNNISPVRRRLAWPDDDGPGNKVTSIGSIPTPAGYKGSVSASSDDFEMIESNGRPPTPRLKDDGIQQRHHLDLTTPSAGGAILTSPKPIRKNPTHQVPSGSRTYVAKSAPARTQAAVVDSTGILPGGTDRGFDWPTSDDDDDTLRDDTPPPRLMQQNRTQQVEKVQGSPPPAGKPTRDGHPLNDQLRSPTFQRHSKNFYETNPAMPVMPKDIDPHPAYTWAAAPRDAGYNGYTGYSNRDRVGGSTGETSDSYSDEDDDDVATRRRKENEEDLRQMRTMPVMRGEERQDEEPARQRPATVHGGAKQGPLARPNSASMYGRPMTAYPQTRQAADDNPYRRQQTNDSAPPANLPQNGQSRSAQTWAVPREANVNLHNGDDAMSTPRGSTSDRLSVSGISSVSSSSLASEVLERARKRRDDFWGTP